MTSLPAGIAVYFPEFLPLNCLARALWPVAEPEDPERCCRCRCCSSVPKLAFFPKPIMAEEGTPPAAVLDDKKWKVENIEGTRDEPKMIEITIETNQVRAATPPEAYQCNSPGCWAAAITVPCADENAPLAAFAVGLRLQVQVRADHHHRQGQQRHPR